MRRAGHGIMRYFENAVDIACFFRYCFKEDRYNPLIIHLDRISLLFGGVMRFFHRSSTVAVTLSYIRYNTALSRGIF